jgi:predicted MFS family arabinose efflux permease
MLVLASLVGATSILAFYLREPEISDVSAKELAETSSRAAFVAASSDRDYWLLNTGFAVCGFQLAFIATYLPTILVDGGLNMAAGATVLAAIGLFNIGGTYLAGLAGGRWLKTRVLVVIYLARAAAMIVFVLTPLSTISAIIFGAVIGVLWTATVPLTSALVADLWGRRNLAFLFGIVYVGHQVGAFAGAWTGGFVFDRTGSFDLVWTAIILASVGAAIIHLILLEKPRAIALAEMAR